MQLTTSATRYGCKCRCSCTFCAFPSAQPLLSCAQAKNVIDNIGDVFRVSVPMFLYFGIMWITTLLIARRFHSSYEQVSTQCQPLCCKTPVVFDLHTCIIKSAELHAAHRPLRPQQLRAGADSCCCSDRHASTKRPHEFEQLLPDFPPAAE